LYGFDFNWDWTQDPKESQHSICDVIVSTAPTRFSVDFKVPTRFSDILIKKTKSLRNCRLRKWISDLFVVPQNQVYKFFFNYLIKFFLWEKQNIDLFSYRLKFGKSNILLKISKVQDNLQSFNDFWIIFFCPKIRCSSVEKFKIFIDFSVPLNSALIKICSFLNGLFTR
jgi:hypothetical protein